MLEIGERYGDTALTSAGERLAIPAWWLQLPQFTGKLAGRLTPGGKQETQPLRRAKKAKG
jgi:hypothetical protein